MWIGWVKFTMVLFTSHFVLLHIRLMLSPLHQVPTRQSRFRARCLLMIFTSGGKEKIEKNELGYAGHGRVLHGSALCAFSFNATSCFVSNYKWPKCFCRVGVCGCV